MKVSSGAVSATAATAPHPDAKGEVPRVEHPPAEPAGQLLNLLRAIERELQHVPGDAGWVALSLVDDAKDLVSEWL